MVEVSELHGSIELECDRSEHTSTSYSIAAHLKLEQIALNYVNNYRGNSMQISILLEIPSYYVSLKIEKM